MRKEKVLWFFDKPIPENAWEADYLYKKSHSDSGWLVIYFLGAVALMTLFLLGMATIAAEPNCAVTMQGKFTGDITMNENADSLHEQFDKFKINSFEGTIAGKAPCTILLNKGAYYG